MTKQFSKRLIELLKNISDVDNTLDREITGLSQNSRTVKPGDLFFAFPGLHADGRKYIDDAIQKGAVAVVAEANKNNPKIELRNGYEKIIPIFYLTDVAALIGVIASDFYQYPSRDMAVIGITGTNGKTSCSHFLAASLQMANKKCGLLGSLGRGFYGALQQTDLLNTPDPIALQQTIADMLEQGAKYLVMEVSSHGLVQERVKGVNFSIGVFTNLNRDHLDYHGDMEQYAKAKRLLFSQPGLKYAVLNSDDAYGQQWAQELASQLSVYTYSLSSQKNNKDESTHIYVSQCHYDDIGITAAIHTPWGEGVLRNPYLIGEFNLSNLLTVVTILGILGVSLQDTLAYIAQLRGVPGRMETFGGGQLPLVVVDYAHKPGALEQVLHTLRNQCKGKLWCVFGCGGNRDKGKRPIMGKIAEQYSDRIIITDDNPRQEDRRQIVLEIMQGLSVPENAVIEHDRRRAIAHAIECAQAGDIVLIAGKGHEAYQIVGTQQLPLSDSLEVQMALTKK